MHIIIYIYIYIQRSVQRAKRVFWRAGTPLRLSGNRIFDPGRDPHAPQLDVRGDAALRGGGGGGFGLGFGLGVGLGVGVEGQRLDVRDRLNQGLLRLDDGHQGGEHGDEDAGQRVA